MAGPIDYEAAQEHTIVVRATSQDGSSQTATFVIQVINESEGNDVEIVGTSGDDRFDVRYTGSASNSWSVHRNNVLVYSGTIAAGGRLVLHGASGTDSVYVYGRSIADAIVATNTSVLVNGFETTGTSLEQRHIRGEAATIR